MSNCKLNVICDVKKALALNSFQNEILPVSIKNKSVLLSFHIEYLFLTDTRMCTIILSHPMKH